MLYYLLFPALWYARPPLVPLFAGALFVAVLGVALPGFPLAIAWLASGFIFWAAGLAVAWWLPSASGPENAPWPSVLLLAFATWQLQIFDAVLNRLGFPAMWASGVLLLLFPAAWLLEAKIQPAIRAWLSRGFGREPASNPRSA